MKLLGGITECQLRTSKRRLGLDQNWMFVDGGGEDIGERERSEFYNVFADVRHK